ncbi:HNH endonuclease [Anaerovoracaceae bacterium 42-11]
MNSRGQQGRFKPKGNIFLKSDGLIYCFSINGDLLFFTDESKAAEIANLNWCKMANGYSATHINRKQIAAHRVIANAPKGSIVDHANGDKKDNRMSNLRICNKSQNAYRSKIHSNNTSGATGVWFRKDTGKWSAEIKNNNKKIVLGCFDTFDAALKARKAAEIKYAKEFTSYDDKQ